ncbi:hypothetical protein SprV_0200618100 [Sparganum proliferum]
MAGSDLVNVPDDKWRSTVVLDRTDYIQKAKRLLEDRQSYIPCESNPMKKLTRKINPTLLAMENSGEISPLDRRVAKAQETTLARFYGLPKVHKEGAPLRPIVSLKGTQTYGLAKWLFRRLKFLTSDSTTTVSSSTQLLAKSKGVNLLPSDVTSLFTSIRQDLAVETNQPSVSVACVLSSRRENNDRSPLPVDCLDLQPAYTVMPVDILMFEN